MVLKDNKKGMLEGTFISDEKGKFKITFNEKEKFINPDQIDDFFKSFTASYKIQIN